MRRILLPLCVFLVAFASYVGVARATFRVPQNIFEGQACAFTPADFTDAGQLRYADSEAWRISFFRQQEYFSAFSVGLAVAFAGFAIAKVRQIGAKAASSAVAGGSLLVGLSLCFSCLAPVLAAIGVGLFANVGLALIAIPKWLIALNTGVLTVWGFLFLSRREAACPVVPSTHGSFALGER